MKDVLRTVKFGNIFISLNWIGTGWSLDMAMASERSRIRLLGVLHLSAEASLISTFVVSNSSIWLENIVLSLCLHLNQSLPAIVLLGLTLACPWESLLGETGLLLLHPCSQSIVSIISTTISMLLMTLKTILVVDTVMLNLSGA